METTRNNEPAAAPESWENPAKRTTRIRPRLHGALRLLSNERPNSSANHDLHNIGITACINYETSLLRPHGLEPSHDRQSSQAPKNTILQVGKNGSDSLARGSRPPAPQLPTERSWPIIHAHYEQYFPLSGNSVASTILRAQIPGLEGDNVAVSARRFAGDCGWQQDFHQGERFCGFPRTDARSDRPSPNHTQSQDVSNARMPAGAGPSNSSKDRRASPSRPAQESIN
jgi:hypothetical protein